MSGLYTINPEEAQPFVSGPFDEPATRSQWHPLLHTLFAYWQTIHPPTPGHLLGRQHFDPLDVPDLMTRIWMLDVVPAPERPQGYRLKYRLVGTKEVEILGREVTGQWLDEAHAERLAAHPEIWDRYSCSIRTRQPTWRRGAIRFVYANDTRSVENLTLPMARNGVDVDLLITLSVVYDVTGRVY